MTNRFLIAVCAVALGLVAGIACGDDDSEDDPRRAQVGAVSESATYAWIAAGAEGLYDYLAADVTAACTVEQIEAALEGRPQPTDWRTASGFEFTGDDFATATVTIVTPDGDAEEEWSFMLEGESWRITWIPGLEVCTP